MSYSSDDAELYDMFYIKEDDKNCTDSFLSGQFCSALLRTGFWQEFR